MFHEITFDVEYSLRLLTEVICNSSDTIREKEKDPFYAKAIRALVNGSIILLMETKQTKAESFIYDLTELVKKGKTEEDPFSFSELYKLIGETPVQARCRDYFKNFEITPAKTANEIISDAVSALEKIQ